MPPAVRAPSSAPLGSPLARTLGVLGSFGRARGCSLRSGGRSRAAPLGSPLARTLGALGSFGRARGSAAAACSARQWWQGGSGRKPTQNKKGAKADLMRRPCGGVVRSAHVVRGQGERLAVRVSGALRARCTRAANVVPWGLARVAKRAPFGVGVRPQTCDPPRTRRRGCAAAPLRDSLATPN